MASVYSYGRVIQLGMRQVTIISKLNSHAWAGYYALKSMFSVCSVLVFCCGRINLSSRILLINKIDVVKGKCLDWSEC